MWTRTARASLIGVMAAACIATTAGTAMADDANSSDSGKIKERKGCASVGVVGDSTALGLMGRKSETWMHGDRMLSEGYTVEAGGDVLGQALAKKGVETLNYDVAAGRSAREEVGAAPNAVDALKTINEKNPDCYLVVLGTNDAANEKAGSALKAKERIESVTAAASQDKPIVWLEPEVTADAVSSNSETFADSVVNFNQTLEQESDNIKNLIVLPIKQDKSWFTEDGIHYTAEGSAHRADAIAEAFSN